MINKGTFTFQWLILISGLSIDLPAQELQLGWLAPNQNKLNLPVKNISFLPEEGLILYNKPNGEMIAKLGRDPRSKAYPNYLLNIFLLPRDRTPELLPVEALAPLDDNCYAIPFVKQQENHVLLFSDKGPYYYWANLDDIKRQNFFLTDQATRSSVVDVIQEDAAGLLIPDFHLLPDLPRENFAYAPSRQVDLFAAPGGKPVAVLSRFCPTGRFTDGNMRMFILPYENQNNCQFITTNNLHHLSDDTYVIPYVNRSGDFILLFTEKENQYWAKLEAFTTQHIKVVGWKTYFIENRNSPAHAKEPGLNLREAPYADAPKIMLVNGEEMDIFLTGYEDGYCEGPWCKVKVKTHKENPCATQLSEEENEGKEYEGWLKLIDDKGQPNVYINTKGC